MCQPAPVATRAWTDSEAKWPGVTFLGIVGDQAHASRRSSHNCAPMQESGDYHPNYAHALDIGHGGNRALAATIRRAFLADRRTRYVIDNGVGYKPDGSTFGSTGHTTHVHISFAPGTTFNTSPWFQGDDDVTVQELQRELVNADKRAKAREEAMLAELIDQAKRHNEAARKRDERIIALLEKIAT